MTLRKSDTQDFWKRLRKAHPELNVKYFCVGEYGSDNHRPHYHCIVFGVPDTSYYLDAWSPYGNQIGSLHVGQVTGDSIAYCMKYIDKPRSRRSHSRDDRQPEFSTSSQGLGSNYITQETVDWHNADLTRNYLVKLDGYKIAMPRYYRQIIYSSQSREAQLPIIEASIQKGIERRRREHSVIYSGVPLEFQTWEESKKTHRHTTFYSQQKERNI